MYGIDDPANLTPEQRLQEIAAILAIGYRRYLAQLAHAERLDCPATESVHGDPVDDPRDGESR